MNQKDKAPNDIPEGELELDEPEEAVLLSIRDEDSDAEIALRRTKQAMGARGLASQYFHADADDEEAGRGVENTNPEDSWEEEIVEERKLPTGYVALGFLALFALVGWGVLTLTRGEKTVGLGVEGLSRQLSEELDEHRQAANFMARIELIAQSYLSAESVAEKSQYVRHRERVAPLMEKHYQDHPLEPREFLEVRNLSPLGIANRAFMVLGVATIGPDGEDVLVSLIAEQTSDDDVLIDWESEVAHQPISIEDYIASKPAESVDFRLYVAEDHFYNFEFTDSTRYQSLQLTEKNSDSFLFGFVERDSEAHRAVRSLLERSISGMEPAIVRVRFLPGSESLRSVLVEEIVAPRWIHVKEPDASIP